VTLNPTSSKGSGSGSGTISDITSTDHTITVTNPTGPTTDLSSAAAGGTVSNVSSADTSIAVANPTTTPVLTVAALNTIATNHATSADWSNNSHKITSVADPSSAQDAMTKNYADTTYLAQLYTENVQTTSYTLVLGDATKVVVMNVGSANNLTIPTNASVAFPTGTVISVFQLGAGQTTVVASGGVTIDSPSSKVKLTGQYSSAALRKRGTNEWVLAGDLSA